MICSGCGTESEGKEGFCPKCGCWVDEKSGMASTAFGYQKQNDQANVQKKQEMTANNPRTTITPGRDNRGNAKILIAVCVILTVVAGIVGVVIARQLPSNRLRNQMELAEHYLTDLDYEKAIAAYEAALQIDPKNTDAYLGLANVYLEIGNSEKALAVLREGYTITGSEILSQKCETVEVLLARGDGGPEGQGEAGGELTSGQETKEGSRDGTDHANGQSGEEQDLSSSEAGREEGNEVPGDNSGENGEEDDGDGSNDDTTEESQAGAEPAVKKTVLSRMIMYENGKGGDWYAYEYDEHGFLIKRSYVFSNGKVYFWDEYEIDAQGHRLKMTGYNADGTKNRMDTYEYDEKGRLIKYTQGPADGNPNSWWEYEYDEQGRRVKSVLIGSGGSIVEWWISEYDDQGNLVLDTHYHDDGSVNYYEKNEFDSSGNYIKCVREVPNIGCIDYETSEYDSRGNRTKQVYYLSDGTVDLSYVYVNEYTEIPIY